MSTKVGRKYGSIRPFSNIKRQELELELNLRGIDRKFNINRKYKKDELELEFKKHMEG